jgi:hypothetical protein
MDFVVVPYSLRGGTSFALLVEKLRRENATRPIGRRVDGR